MIRTLRLGFALSNSAIGLVALKGRRVSHAFTVEGQEQPAAVLRAELDSRRIRAQKARVGIARNLAFVKALDLPSVVEGNLARVVAFELERHVPFSAEEVCFDFATLPRSKGEPRTALVVAAERRAVDSALHLLEEADLRPRSLTVAAHDLIGLLGRRAWTHRAAWIHRTGDDVNLLVLEGRHIRLSRSVPWTEAETLAEEVEKSLRFLRWDDLTELWVSGDGSQALEAAPALAALGPVTPPPFSPAAARAIADLGEARSGLTLLALGVAFGPRRPSLDLLPESLRPRQIRPGQLITAASIAVTALLALSVLFAQGYQHQRYLDRLNHAIRALDAEVRAVERLSADLERKRRLLATVKTIEESRLTPLPLLRELTEIVPPDAWLTTLSLDAKGVELTGQAAAASQLIPVLENSPRLENVEFASPVTKGRDKEQFRIRAGWEKPPKPPQATAPQARPGGKASR